jgi:RHS repeat-associated protein
VVSGTAVYDSFGGRSTTGEAIRYGFTGREHDAESGLIHFRARAYDPATGQFLQRDPIGFAAGDLNLYAYVWNDPYNWTDPSGLMASGSWANQARAGAAAAASAVGTVGRGVLSLAGRIADVLGRAALGFEIGTAVGQAGTPPGQAGAPNLQTNDPGQTDAQRPRVIRVATGVLVRGYTMHGALRAIGEGLPGRGVRSGTDPSAILDALRTPNRVRTGVDDRGRPFQTFTGDRARVTINPATGRVVSVNPRGSAGVRGNQNREP